jgi:hypothetical protein
VCKLHDCADRMRKTLTGTQYKVRVTCFCFSSCMGIFIGDGLWVCLCILLLQGSGLVNTFPQQLKLLEASSSVQSVLYQRKLGD